MLDRRWLYYAAFGVAFTLAFSALGQDASNQQKGPDQQVEPSSGAKEQAAYKPAVEPDNTVADNAAPPVNVPSNNGEGDQQAEENIEPNEPAGVARPGFIWGDTVAQWIMAGAAVLAVVISGAAVELLRRTLIATRKMITEAEKTTKAAQNAVVAANKQAAIAQEATANSERMGKRQTRAYLIFTKISVRFLNNGNIGIFGICQNSGQTPAGNVVIHIHCRFGLDPDKGAYNLPNSMMFYPDIGSETDFPFEMVIDHSIPDDVLGRFTKEKNSEFVVSATVEYRDIFGESLKGESRFWTVYKEGSGPDTSERALVAFPHIWDLR